MDGNVSADGQKLLPQEGAPFKPVDSIQPPNCCACSKAVSSRFITLHSDKHKACIIQYLEDGPYKLG